MNGLINAPYNEILTAIQSISYNYSIIYLLGGNFYLNISWDIYMPVEFGNIETIIQPYYCSQGNNSGCFEDGQRPKITLPGQAVYFNIYSRLILKNVIISHDYAFDPNCTGCNYCPYAKKVANGTIIDDRGNALIPGKFLDQSYCDVFYGSSLFTVYGELIIEVIFYLEFTI